MNQCDIEIETESMTYFHDHILEIIDLEDVVTEGGLSGYLSRLVGNIT